MANQQNPGPQQAIPAGIQAGIDALKAAVGDVETELTALRDQIKTGMSQADVDEVTGQLDALVTRLRNAKAGVSP